MTNRKKILPEIGISLAMLATMLLFSVWHQLPIIFPAGERAAYVGVHYLYPLIGVGIWGAFAYFGQKKALARTFLIALPCYVVVLFAHFNIKLWIPHINPYVYDELYWSIDQYLRPVVDLCMMIRRMMVSIIPMKLIFT